MKRSVVVTALVLMFVASAVVTSMSQAAEGIRVNGSMSAANKVDGLAVTFKKDNPGVTIIVTGSNSQRGFGDLLEGNADMVMMSRQPTADEHKAAKQKGMELQEKQIGRDGIAVIVKPENPVQELTVEQLRGIFTERISNWRELGGQDLPVDFDRLSPEWSETGWFRKHR
ncbi:MAG: substrate-binding domain-containing protein [Pseudomonadota bacterium]